jgi:hypothetical protein
MPNPPLPSNLLSAKSSVATRSIDRSRRSISAPWISSELVESIETQWCKVRPYELSSKWLICGNEIYVPKQSILKECHPFSTGLLTEFISGLTYFRKVLYTLKRLIGLTRSKRLRCWSSLPSPKAYHGCGQNCSNCRHHNC